MKKIFPFVLLIVTIFNFACKGPQGPDGSQALTDPSVQPVVVFTYPPANSVGPYSGFQSSITLQFNKDMNRNSMKRVIRIFSVLNDVRLDTSADLSSGSTMTLNAVSTNNTPTPFYWHIGQQYNLTIGGGGIDVNGNVFPGYSMTFEPEPYFRVVSMTPANSAFNVSPGASIQLNFNSVVDSSIFSAIQVTPAVNALWAFATGPFIDSTKISCTPLIQLNDSTITVSVNSTAHNTAGQSIHSAYSSSYKTIPFRVSSSQPPNGSVNIVPANISQFSINFTGPINPASIDSAVSITPEIPWSIITGSGSTIFIQPGAPLRGDTTYRITLSPRIQSNTGSPISAPSSISFSTMPFQVYLISPSSGSSLLSDPGVIQVQFSEAIDTSTVLAAFSLSPFTPGNITYFTRYANGAIVGFDYSFLQTPTSDSTIVTISQSMKSARGKSLPVPFTSIITTPTLSVTGTYPYNLNSNIGIKTSIDVYLNTEVDSTTLASAFSISPQVSGRLLPLSNRAGFEFVPDSAFRAGASYSVTISTALRAKNGSHLLTSYNFSFQTSVFSITSTSPSNGSAGVDLNVPININTNQPLESSS
ncbi:MAG TPA: Ig-like domain-containing protein, partial [Bacteroidota bacterium]|nr:Ig-like domain-containing protein [Bacteroidota bacterium]